MDMKVSCLAALNHVQAVDLYNACPSYRGFYNTWGKHSSVLTVVFSVIK